MLAALAACGRSPSTTFLTIDPAPPNAAIPADYKGPPLRVPFLHVPITLDRPEFAREVQGTMMVSDFDRWAAPLGLLARNTLIQDLQERMPAGSVLPPDAAPTMPEARVDATVTRFRASAGVAVMDVSYRLVRSLPRSTPDFPGPQIVSLRVPLTGEKPVEEAQAWSALLGQLADRIAIEMAASR
jgi:uncharacterized lipoprotein YmbA